MPWFFRRSRDARSRANSAFTFLEALVTMVVLLLIFVVVFQFMTSVDQSWKSAAADPFAEAGTAFETIAQNLSVATLEPYQDYADSNGAFHTDPAAPFTADHLARRSDLDFVCGPSGGAQGLLTQTGRTTAGTSVFFAEPRGLTHDMAQTGMGHLVNALGYFVEFGGDAGAPSFFTGAARPRWRLKQVVQSSEAFQLFSSSSSPAWIQQLFANAATTAILVENIVALVVLPERTAADATLAPDYRYDSRDSGNLLTRHQLPPRLRLVLAAIDEASAIRLAAVSGTSAPVLLPPDSFQDAGKIDPDVATLDASLTAAKIGHRIFSRDIQVATAAWTP